MADSAFPLLNPAGTLPQSWGLKLVDNGDGTYSFAVAQSTSVGGTARTPSYTRVSDAATIAAGAKSVTIANVGSAAGTVLTVSLGVGEKVSFSVDGADTLGAIAYVATGTTFAITKVT
jgi:hypothetical protein